MSVDSDILFVSNKGKFFKIKSKNDIFYNKFKYLDDFIVSLKCDCPRIFRFLDPVIPTRVDYSTKDIEEFLNLEYCQINRVINLNELSTLITQLGLVLLDKSFNTELNKSYEDYDYSETYLYKDELLRLRDKFVLISNIIYFTDKSVKDIILYTY